MHSDPIADMLTRIRNGGRARKTRVDIPFSGVKLDIALVLKKEGFIGDFREIAGKTKGQSVIEVKLRYDENNVPVFTDLQRVSRPSLRRYMGYEEIPKVRNGLGIMIMTTSQGLMTDREARKARVGGEALCAVW